MTEHGAPGANEPLRLPIVPNRRAGGIDMGAQGRIRDGPAFPDGRQQIVLADHTFTIVKQIRQEVEDLWPDRDRRGRAPKLTPFVVELPAGQLDPAAATRFARAILTISR